MAWDSPEAFAVQVLSEGAHVVMALHGEMDIAGEAELSAAVTRVLESPPTAVTVDLRKLTFLDSTGLRSLLHLRDGCAKRGCPLVLLRGAPAVHRTFEISGLATHFAFAGAAEPLAPALEATG